MYKSLAILTLCLVASSVVAAEQARPAAAIGIGSGALIGGLAAGPAGMILGAAIGGHYADNVRRAGRASGLETELASSREQLQSSGARIASLDRSLFETRSQLTQLGEELSEVLLERAAFEELQLEVLYPTATAELTPAMQTRLHQLAKLLVKLPELTVRLDGYADPRGDESYNQELSLQRAEAVRDQLVDAGIDPARIRIFAHGESTSSSVDGDLDGYAMDRRVRIGLTSTARPAGTVASHN